MDILNTSGNFSFSNHEMTQLFENPQILYLIYLAFPLIPAVKLTIRSGLKMCLWQNLANNSRGLLVELQNTQRREGRGEFQNKLSSFVTLSISVCLRNAPRPFLSLTHCTNISTSRPQQKRAQGEKGKGERKKNRQKLAFLSEQLEPIVASSYKH